MPSFGVMAPLPSPPPGASPPSPAQIGIITLNNQITDNEIVTACVSPSHHPWRTPRTASCMAQTPSCAAALTTSAVCRLYLTVGGGALLLLLFLCFIKPIKLYQTRLVRLSDLFQCSYLLEGMMTCHDASSHRAGLPRLQYLDNVLVKPPAVDFSGLRRLW